MSRLFLKNEELASYKPHFKCYKKKIVLSLKNKICSEIPGDYVVIKPLKSFKGNGVIILHKNELDETLQQIQQQKGYWKNDRSESFIVEEFIESDPLITERLDNRPYDATLRAIFGLVYNQGKITIHPFGMHWKTPKLSLFETGSFDLLHQSFGRRTNVDENAPVDQEMQIIINKQLERALTLLYIEMLHP
ncbi:hypothetical protein N9Y92_01090 [Chlamydiales bacterium]|nr:hypothetical protein [Chlamydiales bacterium]